MKGRIKNIVASMFFLSFIYCSTPPPQKNETQEILEVSDRQTEQETEKIKKEYEEFENALENLRKECFDLREYKKLITENWHQYKQVESKFLGQLNQRQLEVYSEWYDSLKSDNLSRAVLYTKKLSNSLNEKQKALWVDLYRRSLEHNKWVTDFQKRGNEFQNRKNALFNYIRMRINDPELFEIYRWANEQYLVY
jgi:hypothetical protein